MDNQKSNFSYKGNIKKNKKVNSEKVYNYNVQMSIFIYF